MSSDGNSQIPLADNEKKKVLAVYGLFGAALAAGFIPNTVFCLIALLLFIVIVPAADYVRYKAAPDSLAGSHMAYIVRTVWIVSLAAIAMLIPVSVYIYEAYDTAPLMPCAEQMAVALDQGKGVDPAIVMPCVPAFMAANRKLLLGAGLLIGIPATLYIVWRLGYGFIRARRGEPLRAPRRWL